VFQTEEGLFVALGITFTSRINDKVFQLIEILLCFGFKVGYRTLLGIGNRSIYCSLSV